MKTLLFAALLLGCCTSASAQAVRVDPPSVFVTAGTVAGSNSPLISRGGAGIQVCNYPANGAPCTNLATTYQSNNTAFACPGYAQVTLAGTNTCVSTTDSSGRFGFWVTPGNYAYTVQINGKTYGPYPISAGGGGGSNGTPVVLNGADFGMNCALSTFDNATAINSMFTAQALVATATNGQGRLVFPPGHCYVGSTINIPNSNIDVSGAGIGATTIEPLPNKALSQLLLFTGSKIKVHDFTLNGNIANYGISMGVPGWASGVVYNTASSSGGGGPDTVGVATSSTVLVIYQCILAHTSSSGNQPPNSTYWSAMTTLVNSGQQPGGGGALLQFNGPHVDVGNVEMTASQFGIYLVSTVQSVSDVNIHDNYCHDFGVQYSGNGSTMDCIHAYGTQASTGFYSSDVRITGNTFQNIYVPITGPGYTSAGFLAADNVVFSNNIIINCLNRGGGADVVASGASQTMAQNWEKTNNVVTRTLALGSLNNDQTIGMEQEIQQFTLTGNTIVGYQVGAGMTNEGGNTQNGVISGNTIVGQGTGQGTGVASSGVQFNRGGGATVQNIAVVGNKISNFYDGIWINPSGGAGITLGPNQFDTITHTDVDDTGNFSIAGVVMGVGVTVPTVCDVGSLFYATSGSTHWYGCGAINTWTSLGSGGSGGSGTVANGTANYLAYYPSTGTTVSGMTPALGSTQSCGSSTTSCQINFAATGLATGVTSVAISGGGGGSGTSLLAFQTTQSGQVLTANAPCATATPCNVAVGGTTYTFISSATATLSGSTSGTIYEYIDTLGNLTFGSLATLTCSNCTYVSGVTAFPADSVHLYTWSTTGGSFSGTNADLRSFISGSQPLVAGSNITITSSGGIKTISSTGGGGGGTTVTMLPPYIELGTTLYDGTYAVTVPNFTGWTYDFGTTSNTANTNGDVTLAQVSTTQAAFFGQATSRASIEADLALLGGQATTEGGIWMFDGTNYWSLECYNLGAAGATSYFLSLNKYNSSGVFVTSVINGIPINGRAILKETVSGSTLTYAASLNDGASFLPLTTATVGSITRTGLIVSKITAGTNYMDVKSLILN